jgi:hypothetical protein
MAHSEATFEKFQSNCREFGGGGSLKFHRCSGRLAAGVPCSGRPLAGDPCSGRPAAAVPCYSRPVAGPHSLAAALLCSSRRAPAKRARRPLLRRAPSHAPVSSGQAGGIPACSGQAGVAAFPAPVGLPCVGIPCYGGGRG